MSNTLVTSSIVAKESLAILENMCGFSSRVNRNWEAEFGSNMGRGYAPGTTINIRKPPRFTYRSGATASPQSTVQTSVAVTLAQGGCDLNFTSAERTLSISSQNIQDTLTAALATVANQIDLDGLTLAKNSTYNLINPTGALPTTQAEALDLITGCNARLDEMGAPRKDGARAMVMNPRLNAKSVIGLAGLFNSAGTISKQNKTGMMVDSLGLAFEMDQNVAVHTNGAATATNINGGSQTGSTITVIGVAGGTLTKGTTITLPGVYAVNPQSRQSTGVLMDFVVTADVSAAATSIPISPAIVTSGAFQNVTASPTTGQPYVIKGAASTSYAANVAFHRDAFALAMVPMWTPPGGKGVIDVAQETHNGFTIKVTEFYDGTNDKSIMRLDVLYAWAAPYPELSCKAYTV